MSDFSSESSSEVLSYPCKNVPYQSYGFKVLSLSNAFLRNLVKKLGDELCR